MTSKTTYLIGAGVLVGGVYWVLSTQGEKPPTKKEPPANKSHPKGYQDYCAWHTCPPNGGWQQTTDSYPFPMCGITAVRDMPVGAGIAWAPEMTPYSTVDTCLASPDALKAAEPYLHSWHAYREKAWPGTHWFSPLVFHTGKEYKEGDASTGCYYINKATGEPVQDACPSLIPMGDPSVWNSPLH